MDCEGEQRGLPGLAIIGLGKEGQLSEAPMIMFLDWQADPNSIFGEGDFRPRPQMDDWGRIESLRQVVVLFNGVKQSYAAALRRFPMPKCLPEGNDAEKLRQRYNILAIRNPFYKTYRDRVGDYPTPGQ